MKEKVRKLQDKRAITWQTLCKYCRDNGENLQEYGRLCPDHNICLRTRKAKSEHSCPLWNRLRVAMSIEEVEHIPGATAERFRDCQ